MLVLNDFPSNSYFCFEKGVWKAPFIFEKFPGAESLFAGTNAVVVSLGGLLSSIIGGYISDVLANPKDGSKGNMIFTVFHPFLYLLNLCLLN